VVAVAALALAGTGSPADARGAPCPGGRFVVPGPPLLEAGADGTDAVFVEAGGAAIASGCDATRARLVPRRRSTQVRALWPRCASGHRRVRLVGRIGSGCTELAATLRASRRRPRRFVAPLGRLGFLQPFAIDYRYEDLHVIAFLAGHPDYDAIEAFVALRSAGEPLVRAILTRHDRTQVDYLNDQAEIDRRLAGPTRTGREMHLAPIDFGASGEGTDLHAMLVFTPEPGRRFELDLRAATDTLPAFGGLTDPLGHAPDVLPVLFRSASAVGSPETQATIDGQKVTVASAFYTRGFAVAILPAGETELALAEAPVVPVVGARWVYRWPRGEDVYAIEARNADRLAIRRSGGAREEITARLVRDRLHVETIRAASASETASTFTLAFDPFLPDLTGPTLGVDPGVYFTVAVDGHAELITGRVEAGPATLALVPERPGWAQARVVRVLLRRDGERVTLSTAVGG
jgi:hypothetical protein